MPDAAFSNRRLLIVEDDYFWADELRRGALSDGAVVLGPTASLPAAMALVDAEAALDGAIVDLSLRGRWSYALADRLIDRRVPFLFVTGFDACVVPARYAAVPRFEKPVTVGRVLEALRTLLPPT